MSQRLAEETFRSVFKVVDKEILRWFPGHMGRGLKQMQNKLRSVDCIIEVHDARIPISGRNTDFRYTVSGIKPHIIVLNKVDLVDTKYLSRIQEKLKDEYENIVFTNCKNQKCKGVKKLLPLAQEIIRKSDRYNRAGEEDYCAMIIGVPNVGKSSLINALRVKNLHKGNATPVGAIPGVTKSVLNKIKMCENPLFYLYDTPGILTPKVPSTEVGLKLALCASTQDHLVGETVIADFLLYWLNKNRHFEYVKFFELKEATDNISDVLVQISTNQKKVIRVKTTNNEYIYRPHLEAAAHYMLKSFRNGDIGKYVLDEDIL